MAEISGGTGHLAASSSAMSGSGVVITGEVLKRTQTVSEENVVFRPAPHYPLSEAQFYSMVDPPPRSHQWLPTIRGLWFGSTLLAITPVLAALAKGAPITWALVPDAPKFGSVISTLLWIGVWARVRFGPDRRRATIELIRKTWS